MEEKREVKWKTAEDQGELETSSKVEVGSLCGDMEAKSREKKSGVILSPVVVSL